MVAADDVTHGKPHPEPFLTAADRLGVAPADCVALEDSPAGVTAALDAGMRVIAVTTTFAAEDLAHATLVLPQLPRAESDAAGGLINVYSVRVGGDGGTVPS